MGLPFAAWEFPQPAKMCRRMALRDEQLARAEDQGGGDFDRWRSGASAARRGGLLQQLTLHGNGGPTSVPDPWRSQNPRGLRPVRQAEPPAGMPGFAPVRG